MEKNTIDFENMQNNTTFDSECKTSEKELEKVSDEAVVTHYALINLIVILLIGLITAVLFIVLTGTEKVDDVSNPLTCKSFVSGKFSLNIEKSYLKKLPFTYALKNGESAIKFAFGIGNDSNKYERPEEIILVDDSVIEEERQEVQENEELSIEEIQQQEEEKTTTTTKKAENKKTETGAQRVTTSRRETTTGVTLAANQETTTLTTTNNNPPQVMITTTIPPNHGEAENE